MSSDPVVSPIQLTITLLRGMALAAATRGDAIKYISFMPQRRA